MAKFTSIVKASRSDFVYLAQGKERTSGQDAWYYVQIENKMKLPIFLEKIKTGVNLTDYGHILYSGWGTEPPQEIRRKIQEKFG